MTTIAYRAGVLAADSQVSTGNIREGTATKARKFGRILAGGAGTAAIMERFFDWVRNGLEGEDPWRGEETGNGFVVLPDGLIVCWGKNGPWPVRTDFWAIGSGSDIAMGAMAAGASAEEAVALVAKHDLYTGGPIRVLRH